MILVKFSDGLGNQMFQYAVYKHFIMLGKEVYADLDNYKGNNDHNGFEIEEVFNLEIKKASNNLIKKYNFSKSKKINNFLLKRFGKIKNNILENNHEFISNIYDNENKRIIGYWQNLNYIQSIRDELLNDFTFNNINDEENLRILNKIMNCNSVSIHIRRGDYIKDETTRNRYYVCNVDYYNKAIEKMINENNDKIEFFIFSNDFEWVKENIKIPSGYNYHYINNNFGINSYRDMHLMSCCKHNIIANSTFSWWAAYLNKNKSKKIIVPNKWFANESSNKMNLYERDWIRI